MHASIKVKKADRVNPDRLFCLVVDDGAGGLVAFVEIGRGAAETFHHVIPLFGICNGERFS